jgi:ectoine hydroxylase-related dioxygenase (phytanoyl-CoA dioxygenase family)
MSRTAAQLDFSQFHQHELPKLLQNARSLNALEATQNLPALAIRLEETQQSYTYTPTADAIELVAGDAQADTVIEMRTSLWEGLIADLETVPGLLYGNKLSAGTQGDMGAFARWEPVLRSIYHGLPVYQVGSWPIYNSEGLELDPAQTFNNNSDPNEMREFIEAAGYLVIDNVFSTSEVDQFREASQRLRDLATPGDDKSWWGKNSNGTDICTRVLCGGNEAILARLYEDSRIQRLLPAMPAGVVANKAESLDGITVIYKTPSMTEGLSDLPWHRDCGMGGHAHMCPAVNLSIYLHDATAETGELRFLPGSHRASCGNLDGDRLAGLAAPVKAGSVSLHYTDVMHAAPEPAAGSNIFRTSVLLNYTRHHRTHDGGRHYNDVLLGNEDGQIQHMDTLLTKR